MDPTHGEQLDRRSPWWRAAAFVLLAVAAAIALPVAAWVVEAFSDTAESWILPVQAATVVALAVVMGLARTDPARRGHELLWALASAGAALLVVDAVWWTLLAG